MTLDPASLSAFYGLMAKQVSLTLKQLHDATGEWVRRAGASRSPVPITDRGEVVAVLAHPALVRSARRQRVLLPEFRTLMAGPRVDQVTTALDQLRGNR